MLDHDHKTKSLNDLMADNTMPAASELVRDEGNGVVRCLACAHRCRIASGKSGICRVRFNVEGILRVPAGYAAGLQVDPIEKKPFYHVLPGRQALSFGMLGCNFHCPFCQNWISSQTLRDDEAVVVPIRITADRIHDLAIEQKTPVVVSTYNEPLITADWAAEIFKLVRNEGIHCGFVSNGHATPEVLRFLRPFMDLYKVDLKSFNDRNYRSCGGKLQAVLDSIRLAKELGFWVEVVTLLIPQFNDSDDELGELAKFLVSVSADIPWHITAFHPDYKMTSLPRTPTKMLVRAHDIGRKTGLKFVYVGNVPGEAGQYENTYCPNCGELLIGRHGFYVHLNRLQAGQCPKCQTVIPGIWDKA